jgi:hypothetical protein
VAEVDLKLNERELSLMVNALQKEGLSIEETALLRKISDKYKEALTKVPPAEA